jgi:hypothetical protein
MGDRYGASDLESVLGHQAADLITYRPLHKLVWGLAPSLTSCERGLPRPPGAKSGWLTDLDMFRIGETLLSSYFSP